MKRIASPCGTATTSPFSPFGGLAKSRRVLPLRLLLCPLLLLLRPLLGRSPLSKYLNHASISRIALSRSSSACPPGIIAPLCSTKRARRLRMLRINSPWDGILLKDYIIAGARSGYCRVRHESMVYVLTLIYRNSMVREKEDGSVS